MCFLKDAFSVNDRTKIVHINNPVHSCSTYSSSQLPPPYGAVHYPPPYSGIGPMPFHGNGQLPFYQNSNLSLPSYHKLNHQQYDHHSCANQNHNQNQSRSTINLAFNPSIEVSPNLDISPVNYNAAQSNSTAENLNAVRNRNDNRHTNNFTSIRNSFDNRRLQNFYDIRNFYDNRHWHDNHYFESSTDFRTRQNIRQLRAQQLNRLLQQPLNKPILWNPRFAPISHQPTMNRAVGNFAGRLAGFSPYMQQQEQDRGRRRLLNRARCMDPTYDYDYWYPDYEGMTQPQSHPQNRPQARPHPQTPQVRFQDNHQQYEYGDTDNCQDYFSHSQSYPRPRRFGSYGRRRGAMPMYNPWEESEDEDEYSDYEDEELGWAPWGMGGGWGGGGRGGHMGVRGRQQAWWGASPWVQGGQMGMGWGGGGQYGQGGLGIRARNRRWAGGAGMGTGGSGGGGVLW